MRLCEVCGAKQTTSEKTYVCADCMALPMMCDECGRTESYCSECKTMLAQEGIVF